MITRQQRTHRDKHKNRREKMQKGILADLYYDPGEQKRDETQREY